MKKLKVTLNTIFGSALVFILAFMALNWDAVDNILRSRVYTQSQMDEEYNRGYNDTNVGGEGYLTQLEYYKSVIADEQEQIQKLSTIANGLDASNSQYNHQLIELNQKKASLQSQLDDLKTKTADNEVAITSLQSQIDVLQSQIDSLTSSSDAKDEEIAELNSQITTLQENLSQLETENKQNTSEISSLNTQLSSLNSQIDDINKQYDDALARIEQLNAQIAEMQASIDYYERYYIHNTWTAIEWDIEIEGFYIWTDGAEIFFSDSYDYNHTLDKETNSWKKDSVLKDIYGPNVWNDGETTYYSAGKTQYVWNANTHTWRNKTWSGLTSFFGQNIWTDGENVYYGTTYMLDRSTDTWIDKIWYGLEGVSSGDVCRQSFWTDGNNIYFSPANIFATESTQSYKLNKETSTWSEINFGIELNGSYIWTDGKYTYYSKGTTQYVFDSNTETWSPKVWAELVNFYGYHIWTDGTNTYYSVGTQHYKLCA